MYEIVIMIAGMDVWLCKRCGDRGGEGWVDGWIWLWKGMRVLQVLWCGFRDWVCSFLVCLLTCQHCRVLKGSDP